MYVKVKCLCGKENKLNEARSKKCRCGAVTRIAWNESEDSLARPYFTLPDGYVPKTNGMLTEIKFDNGDHLMNDGLEWEWAE